MSFKHFALAAALCAIALPTQALPAFAEDKPVLTVYTYDSFAAEWGPGPALKVGFEKTCGCTVNYATSEDAISTLRKVQLEGPASPADVVVGLDTATAPEARKTGLFAAHGLTLPKLAIDWADPDFVPFDYGYFAFVYDKQKTPNPPKSFEELIALPPGFKVVLEDPRSSTPGLGNVIWIRTAYGDRAPKIWAGLKPHILTLSRGWSEAYGLFLDGQADMVLSYTTSPAYHAIAESDDKYAYAEFTEGYVPQVEVAGVLKTAKQPELARQFLAYLVTTEAQTVIPTTNWMYPVLDIPLPPEFGTPPANALKLDETVLDTSLKAWVSEALAALQ